ncbi:MAG: DUF4293 domain-containing protein [Bacteroidota bacterium]|nr:DUF4293 domain-containing protein [Bacteroidota bacterium]
MIQRIQTVYLLLVAILSTIVVFSPVSFIATSANVFDLSYKGFSSTPPIDALHINTWPLTLIAALIPLVALASIFLYKKRKLQIRLNIVNFLLIDVYYLTMLAFMWFADARLGLPSRWGYHLAASLPAINMVFTFLAIRGIQNDEKLVRSLDRLR